MFKNLISAIKENTETLIKLIKLITKLLDVLTKKVSEEPVEEVVSETKEDNLISEPVKNKILQVINIFETGKAEGDYGNITILPDGPGGMKQITYGRSQTTEFGKLKTLIQDYLDKGGKERGLEDYLEQLGERPSLRQNQKFLNLLKEASKDPIMIEAQDEFFDREYWEPAYRWFKDNGFTKPLSMLVIYDSFIHSGGILSFLRKRFKESPPKKGGVEEIWVRNYVDTRNHWLANHSRLILRKTIYRTKLFKELLGKNNWGLEGALDINGVKLV